MMKKLSPALGKLFYLTAICLLFMFCFVLPDFVMAQSSKEVPVVVKNSANGKAEATVLPAFKTPPVCAAPTGKASLGTSDAMDKLRAAITERLKTKSVVHLDLFVMSQCPFGVMAEQSIIPAIREFGSKVELRFNYVVNAETINGKSVLSSIHGQPEIDENIRQLIIARDYPSKLGAYLLARAENFAEDKWRIAAEKAGIDVTELSAAFNQPGAIDLLKENMKQAQVLRINASPKLLIDGIMYNGVLIGPDPDAATQCQTGTDPFTGKAWVACVATPTYAWLAATTPGGGQYHSLYICQSLGYAAVGQFGGTCGTVCGYCASGYSCSSPQSSPTFDGGGSCGSDANGPILCNTVMWECTGSLCTTPDVNQPTNQTVCNGAATAAVNFSGSVVGTVFNWTNSDPTIGLAASGTGNIASFTAVNTGSTPKIATITVTPVNGACTGTPKTFTITVNPTPDVAQPSNQVVCNGAPTTAVTFTGSVAGTVFNWTNSDPSIGLAASGTGNIASFNGINAGTTPKVATITVTPQATSGTGTTTANFNYTGAVQTWTVPAGVTSIDIDARGAQGGGNGGGGKGARMVGTYSVTPGQVLNVVVGQQGLLQVGGNTQNSSGGGGGSFVYLSTGPTLLVAAGGGGGKCNYTGSIPLPASSDGQITTSGANATASSYGTSGTGGTGGNGGNGGAIPGPSFDSGGGAGWLTPGTSATTGGKNAAGGWAGGNPFCGGGGGGCGGFGGFGGGGGAGNDYGGGGGGGGYSGGGGGADPAHGGGGGSYSIGTAQSNTAGFQTGNGLVTITYAAGPICTGPSKSFTITVNPTPFATIVYAGTPYCSNGGTATVTRTGTAGGTYTAAPAGLTLNASTGDITLGTSTPGTYTVTYTIAAAGGCPSTTATTVVTINQLPAATISYAGSPYCSTAPTATVTRTGTAGGTYSASPAGLTINASTGTVTPNSSTPGTYTVSYTIPAAAGCGAVTATTSITITQAQNAIIFYAGTPYCQNAGTATVTRTGTAGGTYSASPAGLSINAATGAVTLGTSTPGTYTVTYTMAATGGCGITITTTTITVTATPNATIAYAASPYCSNGGTATVTQTGTTGGTYSATPAGLTLNATTGAVTLGTSTPGTYTVTYTIAAAGGCAQFTTTATITITALPVASISYAGNPYCSNAGTATVTRTGTAGGTYSAAPAGLSINASTGDVTLGTSTPGTYTVSYTIAAGAGCPAVTATTSITVTQLPAATISYAGGPYCPNATPGTVSVTQTGTTGGTYSASPAGLSINASTGTITLATSTPGTYTVTYTIAAAGGCGAVTATATVVINSLSTAPTAATATPSVNCGPANVTLTVSGGSLGTGASWKWYSGSCGGTAVGTGASITVATSGSTTYYVRAEGTCNTTTCASVSVTINTQPTVTVASSRATLKPFETATLTATVTPAGTPLQWYKNGVAISGATATTLTVTVDGLGTYTARATTGAGCTALSSGVTITAEGSNRLFITPNPNNGQFKVRYYSSAIQLGFLRHLVMYDESGRRVYDQTFPITGAYSSMNVDARHLGHGTYVVMVTDAFGREVLATGKVVLQ